MLLKVLTELNDKIIVFYHKQSEQFSSVLAIRYVRTSQAHDVIAWWGIGANVQMVWIAHQGKLNPVFELHNKASGIRCYILITLLFPTICLWDEVTIS